MHRTLRLAATALALVVAAAPARAQLFFGAGPTTTTALPGSPATPLDAYAAFLAAASAVGPTTLQTFEGFADGTLAPSFAYVGGTATVQNGFGVTSTYQYNGVPVSGVRGYGAYPDSGIGGDPQVLFSTPVRAFGAFIIDTERDVALTISFLNGTTDTQSFFGVPDGSVSFFGIVFADNVVTGLALDIASDDAVLFDDFTVGVTATPEPAPLALAATGLGALALLARRRRAR